MNVVKMQVVTKQIRGVSYKPTDLHDSLNSSSVILLRANNIDDGKINFDDVVYVDKSKVSKDQYLKKGDKVADIGTGSGILSICAIKFGASSAYGCDIDDTVIDVCRENAKINGIDVDYPQGECNPAPVKFELNTADKITEKFDFVCANILHNVLAEIMGDLKNIMKDDAKMSLSGILDEKKSIVLEAIEREGLKIIDTISQDQWISFVVTK